jgi:type IV secretion system protein VirD4
MPTATITQEVKAPKERIAELLRTSLAAGGWRVELINEDLCELAANQNRSERVSGVTWNYEYRCVASWEPDGQGVKLYLEIHEEKNQWTLENCKTKALEIVKAVLQKAEKLQKLEQSRPAPTRYGSARWGTHEDLEKAGYWGGHEDPRRLVLGPGFDDNYATLTPEDSVKHAIVCGPTGSGKTTAVFIPNLSERLGASVIVTEATAGAEAPDLYSKTAGYRRMCGDNRIYYFNPDDLHSDRINPLDVVNSYARAQELSQLVIENTTSKNNYGDDVWPKSEANLLTILIAHAAAEKQHLGYIRALLRDGPDGLMPILEKSKVEQVRHEYRGFCNNARDGFKYGVFAGLMQRLGLWVNPRIVALTEKTDIDIEGLAGQLFSFYLATPAQKTHLKPIAALIFNFILDLALNKEFKNPLYLSLDEFTNFGMIPGIAEKLSIIRHKKIGVMLGFQDYSQLLKVYGKDDATQMFSQPGTKFFFRPRTLEVAEKISKMAGMTTVYERKMTSSGHIQERESGRPLIDPGEVLALPEEEMIVFTPKCPPLKMPRFTWEDYKDSMAIPPLPKMEVMVDERLVKECNALKEKTEWQERAEQIRKQEQEGKPKQQAKPEQKPQNNNQGAPKKNRNRFKERQQRPKDERQEAQEKPKSRVIEPQETRTKQEKNKGTSYD